MCSLRDNLRTVATKEWVGSHHQSMDALPFRVGKSGFDFVQIAGRDNVHLPAKSLRRVLCIVHLPDKLRIPWVHDECGEGDVRHQFVQQPQSLRSQFTGEPTDPRYVPAGRERLVTNPTSTRVGAARERDGNACRRRFCRQRRSIAPDGSDHGYLTLDQVHCKGWQQIILPIRPTVFKTDIATVDIAHFLQALMQSGGVTARFFFRSTTEESDYGHRWLLRVRCRRPRGSRTDQQSQEFPPLHSITPCR